MLVVLKKDTEFSLPKENFSKISVGAGWDAASGNKIDLDLAAVLEGSEKAELIYYGGLKSKDGSVVHSGDNRSGAGEGDDEVIAIDFTSISLQINKVTFVLGCFSGQNFGQIKNEYINIRNEGGESVAKSDDSGLPENHKTVVFGVFERTDLGWVYKHKNESSEKGFTEFLGQF
jgi:stress response protein SCP2